MTFYFISSLGDFGRPLALRVCSSPRRSAVSCCHLGCRRDGHARRLAQSIQTPTPAEARAVLGIVSNAPKPTLPRKVEGLLSFSFFYLKLGNDDMKFPFFDFSITFQRSIMCCILSSGILR